MVGKRRNEDKEKRSPSPREFKKKLNRSPQELKVKAIEAFKIPEQGHDEVWDTKLARFGVRLSHTGKQTWIVSARIAKDGKWNKPTRVTIGVLAAPDEVGAVETSLETPLERQSPLDHLTLAQARIRAAQWIDACRRAKDPRVVIKQKLAQAVEEGRNVFSAVREIFLDKYGAKHLKPRTLDGYRSQLRDHELATWERRPIASITRKDVIDAINRIAARGAPIHANRVYSALSKMMNWARNNGFIELSPCQGVEKPGKERSRDRVLSDEEIGQVWRAAEEVGGLFEAPVKLMLLLGERKSEVGGMLWSELSGLSGEEPLWTIPAERTKTTRVHLVPLPPMAAEIIRGVPRREGVDFLFGRTGTTPISGWSRAKGRIDAKVDELRRAAGLAAMPHWVLHDLRRTVRTNCPRLGVLAQVARAVINQVQPGIDKVYDRYDYFAEKLDALFRWEQHVRRQIDPRGPAGRDAAATAGQAANRPDQPDGSSDTAPGRGRPVPETSGKPPPSPRALAERLVAARKPDGAVYTTAQIEKQLVVELGITRTFALSAATKAVRRLDPGNPARRTHRRPVSRRVDGALQQRMQCLAAGGMTPKEIGREIGADPKTVRIHLGRIGSQPTRGSKVGGSVSA